MGVGKSQTIGYHYFMTLLIGMGRGPLDEIRQITAGDALAWDGHCCDNSIQSINKPKLFGGEKKEGGIQGLWRAFMGRFDQVLPGASPYYRVGAVGNAKVKTDPLGFFLTPAAYKGFADGGFQGTDVLSTPALVVDVFKGGGDTLDPYPVGNLPDVKATVGSLVSEFRGTAMIWFDGLICSINPYPKKWKIRVRRAKKGWYNDKCWYSSKAFIFLAENYVFLASNSKAITYELEGSIATVSLTGLPKDGDTLTLNGVNITFTNDTDGELLVNIKGDGGSGGHDDRATTAARLAATINAASSQLNATATASDINVTISLSQVGQVIHAMNGAHILYECSTNPSWGRALDPSMIDEGVWVAAANTLCNEGLGLCLKWSAKPDDLDNFIQTVLDHIGGVLYTDRETGLLNLKLVRNDYTVADLPVFSPGKGLISIEHDDTASSDAIYNEVIVTGHSPITDQDIQARSQSPAGRLAQGAASTMKQDYKGLPTVALCGRIAHRDLKASISGLKKLTITLDRRGWRIAPGMPFVIHYPERGIENLVVRAGEIDDGKLAQGSIKIKVVQDVFGLPATSYTIPTPGTWQDSSFDAVPALDQRMIELGYRDVYLRVSQGDVDAIHDTDAYIGTLAAAPRSNTYDYKLQTYVEGESVFTDGGTHAFTATAQLVAAIGPTDTKVKIKNGQGLGGDLGRAFRVDSEIMRVDGFDNTTYEVTVVRGCADTLPADHAADARCWFPDDDFGTDSKLYTIGEEVHAFVLTNTSQDTLSPLNATELTVTTQGRIARPYPPADVKVSGTSIYAARGIQQNPVFTWSERNRVVQADKLIGYFEATVAPEAGTTYRARIYDNKTGNLVATHDGIVSGWTYDDATATADSAPNVVQVEIVTVRDGLESRTPQRFKVVLKGGWGYSWGYVWGV